MLSLETLYALVVCIGIPGGLALLVAPARGISWDLPIIVVVVFLATRSFLYFWSARETTPLSDARDSVLMSRSARSHDAMLRKTLLAPVFDVPILDVGVARVRFFSDGTSTWMRLRLKTRALRRAPWLQLQGAHSFWLPTRAIGAKRLRLPDPTRRWRYWRLPWKQADPAVEDADFRSALPATRRALALTSRPGHLLIRAECVSDASIDLGNDADFENGVCFGRNVEFENAVRLATAWVKAVQQTTGAHMQPPRN